MLRDLVLFIRQAALFVVLLLAFLLPATTFGADPYLDRVSPTGGQRGQSVEVTLHGKRLRDAKEVIFYSSGIQVTDLQPVKKHKNRRVAATFEIAPDAPLGEHLLRVRTASGISRVVTFYVGPFPTIPEKEPNDDFEHPQTIEMNVTVEGRIPRLDVDYFRVKASKGQRISVEVVAMRLGITFFDPYVAILDSDRFTLARSDDTALHHQDPICSAIAPEDGWYIIKIRESAYGGGRKCYYRLHIGDFPRPMVVYPLGGRPGQKIKLRFIGDPKGPVTRKIKLPTPSRAPVSSDSRYPLFLDLKGSAHTPSPVPFRLVPLDNVLESEPNDRRKQASGKKKTLPAALNGVIQSDGDVDWFVFTARKKQRYHVRVYARTFGSPLDPVINLYNAKGKHLKGNDDSGRLAGLDSYLRFRASKGGKYYLRVRDHLGSGGGRYVYRVEITPVKPRLRIQLPLFSRFRNPQNRHTITVPCGGRVATVIRANRQFFRAKLALEFPGLPEGVQVHVPTMPRGARRVPVVFEAAEDAPLDARLVEVTAHTTKGAKRDVEGRYRQPVKLVRAEPNRTVYYKAAVHRLAVGVGKDVPFTLRIVEPEVPLVRRGSMKLKIVAEREKGFDRAIRVQLLTRPPGVSARRRVTIKKGKNSVEYPLSASRRAALGKWKIAVVGRAGVGYGRRWVSSQLATLKIAKPLVTGEIQMTAAQQGSEAKIVLKLEHRKAFEGKAIVKLLSLPARVEAPERTITAEDERVVFPVKVHKKSRTGKHKFFARITVHESGEPIVHNTAHGSILRIDPPPPPRVAKKQKADKQKDKKKDKPKQRLTRLELLRKRQAQR